MVYVAVLLALIVGVLLGYLIGHRDRPDTGMTEELNQLRGELESKSKSLTEALQDNARLEERLSATAIVREELDRSIEYVHSLLGDWCLSR